MKHILEDLDFQHFGTSLGSEFLAEKLYLSVR